MLIWGVRAILILKKPMFFGVLCRGGDFTCSEMDECYLGFIIINDHYFKLL